MTYIAHIRETDKQIQTVEEHLLGVQALAEGYGEKVGVKHLAGLAGVLHDMGKYTDEFRTYIWEAVNNPDAPPRRGSVDHSTAGGRLLFQLFHAMPPSRYEWMLAEVVGNAIISHHSYLHDFIDPEQESPYLKRVRDSDKVTEFESSKRLFFNHVMSEAELRQYVAHAVTELEAYMSTPFAGSGESKLMFLTKLIFSALIDADRTNTRLFEENATSKPETDRAELFGRYYDKLMDKLNSLHSSAKGEPPSPIHALRKEMSEQCDRFAGHPSGIYKLSIPTGGGKTLASLRYALQHAKQQGKRRIVYVVPYTTIIEQNAEEVRRILQDDEHILEHHSNVVDDTEDEDEADDGAMNKRQKLKLARDNWDSPIIFTTMVQFLNVFYAKGSSNIRRLHQLCESVIIFDEVQKVPVACVSLFNQALNFLKSYGRSSLVLCTATQPTLAKVDEFKLDMGGGAEMIDDLPRVIDAFKRVDIVDATREGAIGTEQLAELVQDRMNEVRSVLVILNTKAVVRRLYSRLKETGEAHVYHLSTSMCAAHRSSVLEKVRQRLRDGERVVCISTQLIEAGVDVSFECVVRSLAGLDSIAQAAGRCNRHGEREIGHVYVIDHAEESLNRLPEIKAGKEQARNILIDLARDSRLHGGHLLSAQAMEKYFREFYAAFESSLNYFVRSLGKNMTDLLTENRLKPDSYDQARKINKGDRLPLIIANSYRTAAEHFQVIDDRTTSVLVPYGDEGKELIARLNGDETIADLSRLLRRAQQFSVNVFEPELRQLEQSGGLVSMLDGKLLALTETAYSSEYGLDPANDGSFEMSMF